MLMLRKQDSNAMIIKQHQLFLLMFQGPISGTHICIAGTSALLYYSNSVSLQFIHMSSASSILECERASQSVSQSVKQIWRIKKGIPVPVSNKRTLHFQFYFLHFHFFCCAVPSPTMCFPYVGSEPHVLFDILAEPGDTFHFLYFLHVDFLKVPTLEHGTKTKQTMKRGM